MTVGDMLSKMSSGEITEWMAFYKLQAEPEKQNTAEVIKAMFAHRVKKSVK